MAGGAGFVAGGFVAGPTGAHRSGELAKLSGARDQRGERTPQFSSSILFPLFLNNIFLEIPSEPFLSFFLAASSRPNAPSILPNLQSLPIAV